MSRSDKTGAKRAEGGKGKKAKAKQETGKVFVLKDSQMPIASGIA